MSTLVCQIGGYYPLAGSTDDFRVFCDCGLGDCHKFGLPNGKFSIVSRSPSLRLLFVVLELGAGFLSSIKSGVVQCDMSLTSSIRCAGSSRCAQRCSSSVFCGAPRGAPKSFFIGGSGSSGSSPLVRKAQRALKDRGIFSGGVDGVMGPKTAAAIRDFQSQMGLAETGKLDLKTMKSINEMLE